MPYSDSPFALTPWVRRLLAAMGVVYLLQLTIFTSPWLIETFGYIPSETARRPWTMLTYALLHGSFLHLLFNALALFMFGRAVEGRLGGTRFARLCLVAAIGGAALSLLLVPLAGDGPIIGASASVFGVMLAFVLEWPDAPVLVFPIPFPIKAKWLVVFLAGFSLMLGLMGSHDGVAHFAHLGGFGAAFLYLRGPSLVARRRTLVLDTQRTPAVLVRPPSADRAGGVDPFGPPRPRSPEPSSLDEINRVLDKISAGGMDSLTAAERRFLDETSKRFRQDS